MFLCLCAWQIFKEKRLFEVEWMKDVASAVILGISNIISCCSNLIQFIQNFVLFCLFCVWILDVVYVRRIKKVVWSSSSRARHDPWASLEFEDATDWNEFFSVFKSDVRKLALTVAHTVPVTSLTAVIGEVSTLLTLSLSVEGRGSGSGDAAGTTVLRDSGGRIHSDADIVLCWEAVLAVFDVVVDAVCEFMAHTRSTVASSPLSSDHDAVVAEVVQAEALLTNLVKVVTEWTPMDLSLSLVVTNATHRKLSFSFFCAVCFFLQDDDFIVHHPFFAEASIVVGVFFSVATTRTLVARFIVGVVFSHETV